MKRPCEDILKSAEGYSESVAGFLADIVSIPSPSGGEREVVQRIGEEMTRAGFDEVRTDRKSVV